MTVGGNAGSGGNGGTVTVTNTVDVLTRGSDADGIYAQSVGGGGGSAGKGSSTAGGAQDPEEAAKDLAGKVSGGLGLGQNVTQLADGVVKVGDGALKDVNKLSQLEAILPGGDDAVRLTDDDDGEASSIKLTATIGGQGGAAGSGNTVTVENSGNVATFGARSDGIFAQNLGGGGGVGGASSFSGTDGDVSGKLTVGASGAGGGNACVDANCNVTVTNDATGSITTSGVTANGIVAQSVGGGGGKGGVTGSDKGALKDLSITLGGSGGQGGVGGPVFVNDYGAIDTHGRHAVGILAQSTGGGGGIAHVLSSDMDPTDSEDDDVSLQVGIGGNGGGGGNGGPVTVDVGQSGVSHVNTTGAGGIGIVAQSVGGGGGMVVATTAVPDSGGSNSDPSLATVVPVTIGGSNGASGDGGPVSVTLDPTSANHTTGYVQTFGADAYGVLAQSVGGGGGLVVGASNPQNALNNLFPASNQSGNGGSVNVLINNGFSIGTSGAGAIGIFAQSIGGGGGVIGGMSDVDLTQGMKTTPTVESGQGGNVSVDLESGGNIVTRGRGAHAIFAQSVGGGGGVVSQPDGTGYAFSGASPYTGCSGSGCTGAVTVTLGGNTVVRATGPGAYAVYVQSRGNGVNTTTVNVNNDGFIESWGQSAGGIYVDGGGSKSDNVINVAQGGFIDDGTGSNIPGGPTPNATGVAITGSQPFTVNNAGTINGSFASPGGDSTINNGRTGVLNAGGRINLGKGGRLINKGAVTVGGIGRAARTMLTGSYLQRRSGVLRVDVDRPGRASDRLKVSGDVRLAGTVEVNLLSSTRKPTVVLRAGGDLSMDESFALVARDGTAVTAKVMGGGALQVKPGPRPRISGDGSRQAAPAETMSIGVPDAVGRYLGRRIAHASDALAARPDDDRLGLAVFPLGGTETLTEAEPAADPTRLGFDAAYAPEAREGGVGFTYGLGGGMTVGLAVTSRDGTPAWSGLDEDATDAPASEGVSGYVRQRLGMVQLDTRFAYSRDRQDTADLDLGAGDDRGAFAGRALDVAQRIGVPVRGAGYTLTPWAQVGYQNRQVDGFDLDGGDQRYDGIEVGDTLASFGLDGRLLPIRLGEAAWLSLGGGLSYTQGLVQDDYRLRVTSASGGQERTVERPTTQTLALGLSGSLALGEELTIDGGLSLKRDVALGRSGAGRIGLAWHF